MILIGLKLTLRKEYGTKLDQARSREINQSIDPNFKEPHLNQIKWLVILMNEYC
jgi:hypothetical protein